VKETFVVFVVFVEEFVWDFLLFVSLLLKRRKKRRTRTTP